jgi:hypothetical protein
VQKAGAGKAAGKKTTPAATGAKVPSAKKAKEKADAAKNSKAAAEVRRLPGDSTLRGVASCTSDTLMDGRTDSNHHAISI